MRALKWRNPLLGIISIRPLLWELRSWQWLVRRFPLRGATASASDHQRATLSRPGAKDAPNHSGGCWNGLLSPLFPVQEFGHALDGFFACDVPAFVLFCVESANKRLDPVGVLEEIRLFRINLGLHLQVANLA